MNIDVVEKVKQLELEAKSRWSHSKSSRQYAADILELPAHVRAEALKKVPDELRATTEFYVHDHEKRLDGLITWVLRGQTREERNRRLSIVPSVVRDQVRKCAEARFKFQRKQT